MYKLLKLFIIILICLQAISVQAQRKKHKDRPSEPERISAFESVVYDQQGQAQGPYNFYLYDRLQAKGNYLNGKRVGQWVFTPDPEMKIIGNYNESGQKHGSWMYYKKDILIADLNYAFGEFHGTVCTRYDNGKISMQCKYKNGLKDSIYVEYYQNGKVESVTEYSEGKAIGLNQFFLEDGKLYSHLEYRNGEPYSIVYQSEKAVEGTMFYSGTLKEGNGSFFIFKINKEAEIPIAEKTLKDGKLHGKMVRYHYNGNEMIVGQYDMGVMIGQWIKYPYSNTKNNPILKSFETADAITWDSILYRGASFEKEIYTITDNRADFPGGDTELVKYLGRKANYPPSAVNYGAQGTVFMRFVIETDGSISDVNVLKINGFNAVENIKYQKENKEEIEAEIKKDIEKACMDAFKNMPYFRPGFIAGMPVRVRMVVPLKFTFD